MTRFSLNNLPEVFVSTTEISQTVANAMAAKKIRKIGSRLYTKNLSDPPEMIVKRHWHSLLKDYFPDALIADRTAIECKPAKDGSVFIISRKKRAIELPGITFKPRVGPPPLDSDAAFIGGTRISSTPRAFLENMRPSRSRNGAISRTLSRAEIEEKLDATIRHSDEEALNNLRDQARDISQRLDLPDEFKKLDELIGSLLGTRESKVQTEVASARIAGKPYDPRRIEIFENLFQELKNTAPIHRVTSLKASAENTNLSFFEAYFSNFIEGTEFEVSEAIEMLFEGKIPNDRPQDAHDIISTYKIVSDQKEMATLPESFSHFIELLRERHRAIMKERPDKLPGKFKLKSNRAGSTHFVEPKYVIGTLEKGYDFYKHLEVPLHRAIYMMFLVSEVHPFVDGNGRTARIMMNAELVSAGEQKIIIPIIYRNNYLSSLKALTHSNNPTPLIRTLDFAQKYTNAISWGDFDTARQMLDQTYAFMDATEAEHAGRRLTIPT